MNYFISPKLQDSLLLEKKQVDDDSDSSLF